MSGYDAGAGAMQDGVRDEGGDAVSEVEVEVEVKAEVVDVVIVSARVGAVWMTMSMREKG